MREVDSLEANRNREKNPVCIDCVIDVFHCGNVVHRAYGAFESPLREQSGHRESIATVDRPPAARLRTVNRHDKGHATHRHTKSGRRDRTVVAIEPSRNRRCACPAPY
ncbi:hypothetical protein [Lysobacter sp. Root690]|uniref:hypothetical protein n=1 Tax=Lysobacter sp. Root690 TaxID=1736588 RepID=UPI0012F85507|nr:hypothetical protein [Lysobacter sp. Root690]